MFLLFCSEGAEKNEKRLFAGEGKKGRTCRPRDFVDEYRIGILNYDKRAKDINYSKFVSEAAELLSGKRYYIKDDLRKYLERPVVA